MHVFLNYNFDTENKFKKKLKEKDYRTVTAFFDEKVREFLND